MFNRLSTLNEYIQDTEDLINIELDGHRNQLIQVDLIFTACSFAVSLVAMVASIFGMNLKSSLEDRPKVFYIVAGIAIAFAVMIIFAFLLFAHQRGLLGMGVRRHNREMLYEIRQATRPARSSIDEAGTRAAGTRAAGALVTGVAASASAVKPSGLPTLGLPGGGKNGKAGGGWISTVPAVKPPTQRASQLSCKTEKLPEVRPHLRHSEMKSVPYPRKWSVSSAGSRVNVAVHVAGRETSYQESVTPARGEGGVGTWSRAEEDRDTEGLA